MVRGLRLAVAALLLVAATAQEDGTAVAGTAQARGINVPGLGNVNLGGITLPGGVSLGSQAYPVKPAYLKVSLSPANSPLTVPIVGPGGTVANTNAVVDYVSVPTLPEPGFTAARGADNKSIVLTVTNVNFIPSSFPVVVGYTVKGAAAYPAVGTLGVTAPPVAKPSGPSNTLAPAPLLGFPTAYNSSDILAGWTSAAGLAFGTIAGYISPIWAGVAAPTATAPGNWTSLAAISQKRFTQWSYFCCLIDLKLKNGVPSALTPACMTNTNTKLQFTVADSRFQTATGSASVPPTVAAQVYPHQIADLKGNPTKPRKSATDLGFVLATAGAASGSSITWASNGASATVSPAPASAAGASMTFASAPSADGSGSEVTVEITPSAGVTLLGLGASLPSKTPGLLKLSLDVTDGATPYTIAYPLVAPFPFPGFNVYGGAGLFGSNYTIAKATVSATQMPAGAALTLTNFDSSVTPRPAVSLASAVTRRAASLRNSAPLGAAKAITRVRGGSK